MWRPIHEDNKVASLCFFIFTLLAGLTMMNMLIGVVCELVGVVASSEKEVRELKRLRKALASLIEVSMGEDFVLEDSTELSKEEFLLAMNHPDALRVMTDVGVDIIAILEVVDFMFTDDQLDAFVEYNAPTGRTERWKRLHFDEIFEILAQLRGTNEATVKDVVDLRKFIHSSMNTLGQGTKRTLTQSQEASRSSAETSEMSSSPTSQGPSRLQDEAPQVGQQRSVQERLDLHEALLERILEKVMHRKSKVIAIAQI